MVTERSLAKEVGYPRGCAGGESRANAVLLSAEGASIPRLRTPKGHFESVRSEWAMVFPYQRKPII
jgi:hypothetical protein